MPVFGSREEDAMRISTLVGFALLGCMGISEAMAQQWIPAPREQPQYAPQYRQYVPSQQVPHYAPRYAPPYAPRPTALVPRSVQPMSRPDGRASIVINTRDRTLTHYRADGSAKVYSIGVGRPGFEHSGTFEVTRKEEWPSWTPPPDMIRRQPYLPRFMAGGESNPLGARALYLGSSLYRIHGTNEPHTIGQAVSSGCFRMLNKDVTELYDRVSVGTKVVVMR